MSARPSLVALARVELRKMIDTRAGFWLQATVVALTLVSVVVLCIVAPRDEINQRDLLALAVQPAAVLLPVLAILLVTSEWSQRTAQVTFTLVPQRGRVVLAKVLACLALSLTALAFAVVVTVFAANIAGPPSANGWALPLAMLGQDVVFITTGTLGGAAFGALLLSSAPAIVLFFVLPTAWTAVGSIHALEPKARWFDGARSVAPLTDELFSTGQWARAATTLALWTALPLLAGAVRIQRSEIR